MARQSHELAWTTQQGKFGHEVKQPKNRLNDCVSALVDGPTMSVPAKEGYRWGHMLHLDLASVFISVSLALEPIVGESHVVE